MNAGCGPESSFETFWSHVTEQSVVEESKVHHQSAYVPREEVRLPKCPKCNAGCSVSLLGYKNEWTSGYLPVAVIAAPTITESGFWRRLTLLPSTDPSLLQTLSFWWFRHCWTSNFFSSVNTKIGTVPSFMRFRMC